MALIEAVPNTLLMFCPAVNRLLLHHSAAYTAKDITGKLGPVLDYIVFLPLVIHIHYQEGSLPAYDGGMVVLHKPFGHLSVVDLPFLVQEIYGVCLIANGMSPTELKKKLERKVRT